MNTDAPVTTETTPSELIALIQAGAISQIKPKLQQLSSVQLDQQSPELAVVLGLLTLSKQVDFQQDLPQESTFVAHAKIVQRALQAYQDNDIDTVSAQLKQLPYRSAFRDFRTILQASVTLSPASLSKVPKTSPYALLSQLVGASFKEGAALFHTLIGLDYEQQNVITDIKKLSEHQLEFIAHLSRQYTDLSDKVKFTIAMQYHALCDPSFAQPFCQQLLANYPEGHEKFTQVFGEVSSFEENRVKALSCEADGNFYDADYYWHQCIKQLTDDDDKLKIALIYRHMADFQTEIDDQTHYLIKSLPYDDDRHCYQTILENHQQQLNLSEEYLHYLSQSIEKFPKDVAFLSAMIKATPSTEQACQSAQQLLLIDPLNSFAKQVLFSSRITQVQQLIRDNHYDEAEQEIQQAEAISTSKKDKAQCRLSQGLILYLRGDIGDGFKVIHSTIKSLYDDPVNITFALLMEGLTVNIPAKSILDLCPDNDHQVISTEALESLSQQITSYAENKESHANINQALEPMTFALKESILQNSSEAMSQNFCHILTQIEAYDMVNSIATSALIEWDKPIFTYYLYHSQARGQAEVCHFIHILKLQKSLLQAKLDKDNASYLLMDTFLQQYYEIYPQKTKNLFKKLLLGDKQKSADDSMDKLFGHISDENLFLLNDEIEILSKKITPEQLANELNDTQDNNPLYLAMMKDPDVFNALIVVKAADQLQIVIDVTEEDVFDYFELTG